MLFENINQLLEPGHLPMETGYCRLSDGSMYVAVLTRMSGCKSRWVEWWFKHETQKERMRDKKSTGEKTLPMNKTNGDYDFHADYQGRYVMEKRMPNISFKVVNPDEYFDASKLKESRTRVVLVGHRFTTDGNLFGHTVHLARDTSYGCEMRSNFWLYNSTEEKARARMEHCIEDMGSLADFLKTAIEKIKAEKNLPDIVCKTCYSDDIVKDGFRKGGQYWLCNNCGHHFLNNQALYRMKYPLNTITKAVNDRNLGKSLKQVRESLLQEMQSAPSNSTIYGWIKKLTEIAAK